MTGFLSRQGNVSLWIRSTVRTALAALLFLCSTTANAGLGPENVFLVVNRASWASLTIANHYVQLRQLAPANICYLNWTGGTDSVDVEVFRQQILGPILREIERRGMADQIDAIVYSSDFPYQVNLAGDLGEQKPPRQLSPYASITSATYLWQLVMTRNPNIINLRNNQYVRAAAGRTTDPATQGFRSWYGWGPKGELLEGGGIHYMLSMMLGVTSGRGNSVPEVVGYLRRSARADQSHPRGTIYYCANGDVRTKARSDRFAEAIDDLTRLGVAAQLINGNLPSGKQDVAGLMAGIADFNWPAAQSTILPGAICEHLTSFGGTMAESAGQTPLTEFLRYGAAGSCGTVVEPYAIQDKFPLPSIHVHYVRGCALAEAFYQSICGPYQLLIVGDPLCQPWATFPKVTVGGVKAGQTVSGQLEIQATATARREPVDRLQLFVDGRRIARRPSGFALPWDTTRMSDGYHELRVVGIESSSIETQGRAVVPVQVNNRQQNVSMTAAAQNARWDRPFRLTVTAAGMAGGVVIANAAAVGKFDGVKGQVKLDAQQLGSGPVILSSTAFTESKPPQIVQSRPIVVQVSPGPPLAAIQLPSTETLARGLLLKTIGGKSVPVQETRSADWLQKSGVKPGEAFGIDAYFDVPAPDESTAAASAADVAAQGVHQFQIRYTGALKLAVDDRLLHDGTKGDYREIFLPVALAPGLHRLRISAKSANDLKLQIRYGGRGTRTLDGQQFRHR